MRWILIFAAFACNSTTEPTGVRPYPNTSLLRQVWTQTEACSGLTGELSAVTVYLAPESQVPGDYWGYWFRQGNRIYISEGYAEDYTLLMHELMHALLQDESHPVQYFDGPCGNLLLT